MNADDWMETGSSALNCPWPVDWPTPLFVSPMGGNGRMSPLALTVSYKVHPPFRLPVRPHPLNNREVRWERLAWTFL